MISVIKLIDDNIKVHKHFEYYNRVIIPKIERNLNIYPDISIEACKSLLEGISKTILKSLDSNLLEKDLEAMDLPKLGRQLLTEYAKHNKEIEEDFIRRIMSLIHAICELRNARGDISHGKIAPKELNSTTSFAQLVYRISEATAYYLLSEFYSIDEMLNQKLAYYSKELEEYNSSLDEEFPMPGAIYYSLALFVQDYPAYEEGYTTFLTNK